MPIPADLAARAADRDYWSSWLRPRRVGPERRWHKVRAEWKLPEEFGLKLELLSPSTSKLSLIQPEKTAVELGNSALSAHTHVLRFEEADAIGRWLSLEDAEWTHPGLVLALLQPFTPITTGDTAEIVAGMFWQAWQSLGTLSAPQVLTCIERTDWRGTGVRWQDVPQLGWALSSSHEVMRGRTLRSTRHAANSSFPFTALRTCEAAIQDALLAAIEPQWLAHGGPVRDLAAAAMDDADPARWPILADALEEAGCLLPGMLAAFRPPVDPVRALVMLEILLAPLGVVPGQLLRGRVPQPPRREVERLEIWLPLSARFKAADADELIEMLRTYLFREDQGTVVRDSLQFNELRLRVILRGELDPALLTLHQVLVRCRVPDGTRVSFDSTERHATVWWPDWFDLDLD